MPAIQTSKFVDERKNSDYGPAATFQLDLSQVAGANSTQNMNLSCKTSSKLNDMKKSKKPKLSKKQPEVDEMKFDDIDDNSDLE